MLGGEVPLARKHVAEGAFKALAPHSMWVVVGGLGVLTGIVILSFYSVIAGWTLAYIFKTLTGTFQPGVDAAAVVGQSVGADPVESVERWQ